MNIIEQAAKRLEELQRAGVEVPWAAAGYTDQEQRPFTANPFAPPAPPAPAAPVTPPTSAAPVAVPDAPSVPAVVAPPAVPDDGETRRSRQVRIDTDRLASAGYVVPGAVRSVAADEYRVLKRPLLKNAALKGDAAIPRSNLIQVASALPGEGKTFTAINLALSLSMEVDHSVLLVDADVIRPSVLDRLGLQAERGLMDLLRDPSLELADVMLRTNIPKFNLLPSGTGALNSTELLASGAMERLLDELSTRYADRIIVFDSAPLLAATESRVLATRVGQVVVVVESGRTRRDLIAEAFATVAHCPVVMAVLNKYDGPAMAGPYGY